MKVPTYERQVGESADTGSRNLTAQVSPSSMAAPFQATAQLGNDITKAGLQWYGHELKLKRSIEETNAKNTLNYQSKLLAQNLTTGFTDENGTYVPPAQPKDMQKLYTDGVQSIVGNLSNKFEDKVALKRFMSSVPGIIMADKLDVIKLSRVAMTDQVEANYNNRIDELKDILTIELEGTVKHKNALSELYGDDGIVYNQAGLGTQTRTPVKSIFQKMVEDGILTQVKANELLKSTKEDVAQLYITRELIELEDGKDTTGFRKLEEFVDQNTDLETPTKTRLLEIIDNRRDTFVRQQNTKEERKHRNAEKLVKDNQKKNFSSLYSDIYKWKMSDEWQNDEITFSTLNRLQGNRDLNPSQFETLNTLLSSDDAPITNTNYEASLYARIANPEVTNNELDEILAEAANEIGIKKREGQDTKTIGKLTFDDFNKIRQVIEDRKENTYEGEDAKFHNDDFVNQLDVIIDKDDETYLTTRAQAIQEFFSLQRLLIEEGEKAGQKKYTAEQAKNIVIKQVKNTLVGYDAVPLFPRIIPELWKRRGIEGLIAKGSGEDRVLTEEFINDQSVIDLLDSDNPQYQGLTQTEILNNIEGIREAIAYAKKELARAREAERNNND
jgi:hypothetical protein